MTLLLVTYTSYVFGCTIILRKTYQVPADADPCNCSPRQITFKLDFSGECWNPGLPEGAGAIEDLCTISSPNFEVTPLQLTKIHIEEYDQSGTKVKEFEDFYAADGDTFSYTSYFEENPNSILGGWP